jgi:hypothetical protein
VYRKVSDEVAREWREKHVAIVETEGVEDEMMV